MKTKTDFDKIIAKGYSLDFSQSLDDILIYFKKTALLNGLVLLITSLGLLLIIGLGFGIGSVIDQFSNPEALGALFADTTFLIYYVLSLVFIGVFLAPLYAGFIQINRDIDTSNEVSISNIFTHYKSKYFLQIVAYTLIVQLISSALTFIPFGGTLLSYIFAWFTVLGVPLIIFGNLSAIDAIQYSFKLVAKNPWTILLILIVAVLIAIAGLFALCIGIIFTMPIIYSTYYVLYKNIVGFKEEEIIFDLEKEIENL